MNKYQEALDRIANNFGECEVGSRYYDLELNKDIANLQKLVDKEKPMKPKEAIDIEDRYTHYYCPKCDCKTTLIPQEFCLNCGQRLDWSDSDE